MAELRAGKAKAERAHGEEVAALEARAAAAEKHVVATWSTGWPWSRRPPRPLAPWPSRPRLRPTPPSAAPRPSPTTTRPCATELRALQKTAAQAEQRAAVAEERAQNRDEGLAELRRAVEALRKTSDELGGRLAAAEKAQHDAERELAVARSERVALEKALAAAPHTPHASQNAQPQEKSR